jgi:very-short-patch-repair endonuclease
VASETARQLRKNQTVAEKRLWNELRKLRWQGYHFRRQAPIDKYIVDFACYAQRLIVEVDGIQHERPTARRADAARDADLQWRGFTVLRFRNGDISQSMGGVILEILAALGAVERPGERGQTFPCGSPHPYPLPTEGEGNRTAKDARRG